MGQIKKNITNQLIELDKDLISYFGVPNFERMNDKVGAIVLGILSANTNDINRDRAYVQLSEKFQNEIIWEDVINMQIEELAKIIRPAGMSIIRAGRIQGVLHFLKSEFGKITAEPFLKMPIQEAYDKLLQIKGVGSKTAAVFLVFNRDDDVPYFPVDTHVHRIAGRIGLMSNKLSPAKMQDIFSEYCPPKIVVSLHMNIIFLGRQICHARKAECEKCPIISKCKQIDI